MSFLKNLFFPKAISPDVIVDAYKNRGGILLDVRTKEEFNNCNVKGSINIPLHDLPNKYKAIDLSKPIIVYCATGVRSSSAASLLASLGAKEVINAKMWTVVESALKE